MPVFSTLLRLTVVMLAGLGLAAASATAQHVTVSLGAVGGVPQNEFHDELSRVALGVNGMVLYGIGPIAAGIEAGVLTYDRRAQPLSPAIDGRSALVGDVTRTSSIGSLHGVLRLQLPEGPVRPYVDGLVGFQRFTTVTHFEQNVLIGGTPFFGPPVAIVQQDTRSLDAVDTALSYGAGGGVLLRLARGVDGGVPFDAFLDLGARYIFGEEASYQAVGVAPDGTPTFEVVRSRTDILRPQVSLVIQFGR